MYGHEHGLPTHTLTHSLSDSQKERKKMKKKMKKMVAMMTMMIKSPSDITHRQREPASQT